MEETSFLKQFYNAREIPEVNRSKEFISRLSARMNDIVMRPSLPLFQTQRGEPLKAGKQGISKLRLILRLAVIFVLFPVLAVLGTLYFKGEISPGMFFFDATGSGGRIYLHIALTLVVLMLVVFFAAYEDRRPGVSEMVMTASMVALNVAGRAAFFMFADVKPVYAITIISGIALGSIPGFMTGAMTMLVSNLMFGQGPWTPWQMFALGMTGFVSGVLSRAGLIPRKRFTLSLYGFFVTILVFGGIMNPAAMLLSSAEPDMKLLLASYVSGFPVDIIKGISTFVFLWFGAGGFFEKFERIGKVYS